MYALIFSAIAGSVFADAVSGTSRGALSFEPRESKHFGGISQVICPA